MRKGRGRFVCPNSHTTPMSSASLKLLVIIFLFLGEALSIAGLIYGAHGHGVGAQSFLTVFRQMLPLFLLGNILLLSGFILGYTAFKDIWIVNVISIATILLVEPTLSYMLFQELPTKGVAAGFVCGVVGLGCVIFW